MAEDASDTPPDRLSLDPRSDYFDEALLSRGVGIKFNGQEKTNVIEYSVSEGWIRVAAGKSRDVGQMQKLITLATDTSQPASLRLAMLNGTATGLSGQDARRNSGSVVGGRAGGIAGLNVRPRVAVKPMALPDTAGPRV